MTPPADEQDTPHVPDNLHIPTSGMNPFDFQPVSSAGVPPNQELDLFLGQVPDFTETPMSLEAKLSHSVPIAHSNQILTSLDQSFPKIESDSQGPEQFIPPHTNSAEYMQNAVNASTIGLPKDSSSTETKRSKGKSKESLLNVFVNPLLHAIPILARNCLNFEDFLAQTAMHSQNGLLGAQDDQAYTDPNNLMLDPSRDSSMLTIDSPYRLRVLGLPAAGAKSRVETQIKVCLQLVDTSQNLVPNWSHLKLPEHMVAKEKLKRRNQKLEDEDSVPPVESDSLRLEAAVVCDSHPDNEIIMCASCVHRELKRLKRKRDNKVARAANKEGNAAKLAALLANELPDLNDDQIMAMERRRILLFNCNEYLEFNNGEATLPTRITCYCRHHNEKIGFRIIFTVKDCHNHVIAVGQSPPIMITDDHKSSKVQQVKAPRKRPRTDLDTSPHITVDQVSTKKRNADGGAPDGETDSGVSSPVPSSPATPTSPIDDSPASPPTKQRRDEVVTCDQSAEDGVQHSRGNLETQDRPQTTPVTEQHEDQAPMLKLSRGMTSIKATSSPDSLHLNFPLLSPEPSSLAQLSHGPSHHPLAAGYSPVPDRSVAFPRRPNGKAWSSLQAYKSQQRAISEVSADSIQASTANANVPRLHRLIPADGPIYGGSEVTVLGTNFYEGLTCMFGENPAVPTHCWSNNTLLCILPPATVAGPVVVSFREHPLVIEGQEVTFFTYVDESDRALMELALQVVGLKTMGKVEDARQIAMRIVQGDNEVRKQESTVFNQYRNYRSQLTTTAAAAAYHNACSLFLARLEEDVIEALVALDKTGTPECHDFISLTNANRHSLLHLATLCGYARLVGTLVRLGCNTNQMDRNGYTALHLASWSGKSDIVNLLIEYTDVSITTASGKTAEGLATDANQVQVVQIFKDRARQQKQQHAQPPSRPTTKHLVSRPARIVTAVQNSLNATTSLRSSLRYMTGCKRLLVSLHNF